MDMQDLNMFRIVTEDCYSQSIFPTATQHPQRGLMWKKGEIIQILYFPGGDLYFAQSLFLPPSPTNQHCIWKSEFRDLTPEERKNAGLPARVGAPIGEVDVPVHLVSKRISRFSEDEGAFEAEMHRRSR